MTGGIRVFSTPMRQSVEGVLDRVRPALQVDGGDVELVDVDDGIVTLRIKGCLGRCPMSAIALHCGLENALKEEVEGVRKVVLVRAPK
jgi:Fe-S cluster biogenesis protein NfuA